MGLKMGQRINESYKLMKNAIYLAGNIGLSTLMLTLVPGCCTCSMHPPSPAPPMAVEAAPPPDPMLTSVREWFQERKYVYVTNVEDGVTSYQTYFAARPGDAENATCFISAGTNKDTLTLNALLSPLAGEDQEDVINGWVAASNEHSQWGFYGFDDDGRQMWFRIALFRPDRQVSASDMDRLISEVINAIHQRREFLAALDKFEKQTTDEDDSPPPDDQSHGIRFIKHVPGPRKSVPVSSLKSVNYVHLNNQVR